MKVARNSVLFAMVAMLWTVQAGAQTADEVIEKHLTAIGGRAALAKLQTRVASGTVAVSAQGAELAGVLEVYAKAPNKSRTYFKLDLSQVGAGEMIVDQRCDGTSAFTMNSMTGDREITGNQLQGMLNSAFPSPLLNYKEAGAKLELLGKEKLGEADVFVLLFTPKAGPASKGYFDAKTFLQLRQVAKVDIPEAGGEVEQTTDFSGYKEFDGLKLATRLSIVSSLQALTITLSTVEHNKPLDDAMFARPK